MSEELKEKLFKIKKQVGKKYLKKKKVKCLKYLKNI